MARIWGYGDMGSKCQRLTKYMGIHDMGFRLDNIYNMWYGIYRMEICLKHGITKCQRLTKTQ